MPQFLLGRNDPTALSVEVALLTFGLDYLNVGQGNAIMKPIIAGGAWFIWQSFIVKQLVQWESSSA